MNETKYWKPSSNSLAALLKATKPKNVTGNGNGKQVNTNTPKVPTKFKKVATIAGISLGTILLILGIITFIVIIKPAQAVMKDVNALKADAAEAKLALGSRDLIALETSLNATETDLKNLKESRDKNFGWAKNFGPTKSYFTDSDHFITAGNYAISAARKTIELIKPFADAAGLKVKEDQQVQQAGLAEAFSTWIGIMPQVANQMDPVLAEIANVGKELSYVDASRYPENLRGVALRSNILNTQKLLSQVTTFAPDIKEALNVVPGLLGVGSGEKRYMVIMQNDKELRTTGGFWTSYATFRVNNAVLVNQAFTSSDMYSIDTTLDRIDSYYTFGAPPFPYGKYLKVERWYARDANTSPDLPTSIDNFMKSYNLAMKIAPMEIKPVDAIVTIDTQVISELMTITGPVTVNGVTYNSENVVLELERIASLELREQTGRKKVLGDLMRSMLVNVFESDKDLWSQIIDKGVDLAVRKHITAFSFDPKAQALLEKYNLAGRIVDPVEGDYSFVASTNLGGDKTNWFVNKTVDHAVAKEGTRWVDTVKITYNYKQPAEAFAPFVKRFRDWVRVYAPLNSELISVDGSEDGSGTDKERNKAYFWGYVELGPSETKTLTFKYALPDGTVKDGQYNLYLQKQAGIDTETHTITINGKTDKLDLKTDYQYSKKI